MKASILLALLSVFTTISGFAQVILGPAIMFDYDNVGNRVKRYYDPNTPLNVYKVTNDSASLHPADTVVEQFRASPNAKGILVRVYPNPVTTNLIVENMTWSQDANAEIRLTDVTGKLIRTQTGNRAKEVLPFGDVSPGMYSVQYYLNGKYITSWKVLKN
jgi:hypothetical protein